MSRTAIAPTSAAEDRQPQPDPQDRSEVIALDLGVRIGLVEEQRDDHCRAGEQRESRCANRGHDERRRDRQEQRPEPQRRLLDEVVELGRKVSEHVAQRSAELLGERDVPEAIPGGGPAVDQRRRQQPAADRQLQEDEDDRDRGRAEAADDEPRAPEDARLDREDVQRDGRHEEQRQRVIADREPEDHRGEEQASVGRAAIEAIGGAVGPADEGQEQQRDERQVDRVRVGAGRVRPDEAASWRGPGPPPRAMMVEPVRRRTSATVAAAAIATATSDRAVTR